MTRNETHQRYKAILLKARREGQWQGVMRELALRDLFFLILHIFGRKDVDRDWLYERCREVQRRPDGYLDLWFREGYKSTIITFALTIQDILNDPELTVGIFSATRPIAKAFLRQIKREFEDNAKLKSLFPDICYENPRKESPKWSEDDGIIVKRKGNPKESTVEAWGLVDGQPTGRHFGLMVYDDVVTRESVTTPEMIAKINGAWELSRNLTTIGGRTRHIGTRYHYADTYNLIMEREAAIPRIYPATEDGTPSGKSVFFDEEILAGKRREMGSFTFSTQMLQDPRADSTQGFREEDLRFWPALHYNHLNVYLLFDPANEKKKRSDYTTALVIGMGQDDNYYIIDMIRDRLSLTERGNLLMSLHRQYRPLRVGYEQYGMQADIEYFKTVMNKENYRFVITPLGGQVSKVDRIGGLMPLFEDHRIYLPDRAVHVNYEGIQEDVVKAFIYEEFKAFPFSAHDDMLDCLARITDPGFRLSPPVSNRRRPMQTVADSDYEMLGG